MKEPGCLAWRRDFFSGKLDGWLQIYDNRSYKRDIQLILGDSNEQSKITERQKPAQQQEAFVEL